MWKETDQSVHKSIGRQGRTRTVTVNKVHYLFVSFLNCQHSIVSMTLTSSTGDDIT